MPQAAVSTRLSQARDAPVPTVPDGSAEDAARAVLAARRACDNGRWSSLSGAQRATGIVTPPRACGILSSPVAKRMKKISYGGWRFPPEIIHQAISWILERSATGLREADL